MVADWLPNLMVAWGVQLLGVLSPGPGVALILAQATARGRATALITCLGISLGAMVLAVIAVLGLATLLAEIAWAMTIVKLAGAAFLLWLAWGSFQKMMRPVELPAPERGQLGSRSAILSGLAMQLTNPKAILYWIAAAAVAHLETAPWPIIAIFLAGAWVNSFFGHGLWAVALSSRPFLALYRRARGAIEGALGVFFAFAALKLATSEQ